MSVIDRARGFANEVRVEFWKVSWPTRAELRDSTMVVIATVILVAVFVAIVDSILNFIVKFLFR